MQFSKIAAALAASFLPSLALGASAIIQNDCDFPVYLWSVSDTSSGMIPLLNSSTVYKETYRNKADGGGISIKLAKKNDNGQLTNDIEQLQVEYTVGWANLVYYDLSLVNGNPMSGSAYSLTALGSNCPNVTCAASDEECQGAYIVWNDNAATHACTETADIMVNLCSASDSGSGSSDNSTDSSSSASSSTTAAASTTASATSTATPTATAAASPESVVDSGNSSPELFEVVADAEGDVSTSAAPVSSSSSTSTSSKSTTGKSTTTITKTTYVSWQDYPAKREAAPEPHADVHHARHLAEHAGHAHNRVRRSRVFRAAA